MSKIARKPISLHPGVEVKLQDEVIHVKGKHGQLTLPLHDAVSLEIANNSVRVFPKRKAHPMVGTTFKLVENMINGVHKPFEHKLQLVGVGYRAAVQGNKLTLSVGYSNPKEYPIPAGITIQAPSPSELTLHGIDKQLLGQVAAEIKRVRPVEPYKGKGIRDAGQTVILKQTKKKK